MKIAYLRRRNLVVGLLREIPGFKVNMPDGAFYAFPDVSYYFGKSDGNVTIKDADQLCMWLLETAHVALVGGGSFGAPNCLRLSTAASDEALIEAVARVKAALANLK
jgi:aspartate aminotransferase